MGAVVQSSHYDSAKQIIAVDLLNTSLKEISAFSLAVRVIHPDYTVSTWEYGGDFLPFMSEHGGAGSLQPGATITLNIPVGQQQVKSASATVDVVVYVDGAADVFNKQVFDNIIGQRKGAILGLQKANELLQNALADSSDAHPSVTVAAKLKALAVLYETTPPEGAEFEAMGLLNAATNIANAPKSSRDNEESYLQALIQRHQERIAVMIPHTKLTKGVQP